MAPEAFLAAASEHQPDFIALSALLTATMPNMQTTIEAPQAASFFVPVDWMKESINYCHCHGAEGGGQRARSEVEW